MIKSRRLRWVWHVEPTEDEKYETILVEKPEDKETSEDPGIDGSIILRWILKYQGGRL
jgi:hypothetical protein